MGAPSDARSLRPPLERLRVLRELGSPMGADVAFCAALESLGNKTRLVVVERIVKTASVLPSDLTTWLDHAKQLVPLEHPNVARVRDAIDGPQEAYVVSDFIDGARWADVVAAGSGIPIDVALRVLLDTLGGLGALHNMRDAARQPMGLVHCGVSSETVLVGLDGVSRILGASRLHGLAPGVGVHYLAPEVLLEDDAADARADVYSIGVLLWEALTGRQLFTETGASAIVTAVLSGRIPRAEAPENAPWAAPLVDVAARALSPDPAKRYASAAAVAAELRRIGGAKIVPSLRVAALVRSTFGDRIKARREELERGEVVPRATSGVAAVAARAAAAEEVVPSSTAPTPVPPAPTATTRPPPPMNADAAPRVPPAPAVPSPFELGMPFAVSEPPVSVEPVSAGAFEPVGQPATAAARAPVAAPAFPAPGLAPKGPSFNDAGLASIEADERTVQRAVPFAATAVNAPALSQPPVVPAVAAPLVPRELRGAKSGAAGGGSFTLAPSVIATLAEAITAPKNKRVVLIVSAATAILVFAIGAAVVFGGGKPDEARPGTSSEQTPGEAEGAGGGAQGRPAAAPAASTRNPPAAPKPTAIATGVATAAATAPANATATPAPAATPNEPPKPAAAPTAAAPAAVAPSPDTATQAPVAEEPVRPAAPPPPPPPPRRPVIKYDPQGI